MLYEWVTCMLSLEFQLDFAAGIKMEISKIYTERRHTFIGHLYDILGQWAF